MEYYSAIKKQELLSFVTTWVNLEGIMLSDMKSEKDKYHMISYVESEEAELIDMESRFVHARGWGNKAIPVKGCRFPGIRSIKFQDLADGMMTVIDNPVLYTWKLLRE